jgi:hypothetical protein
MRRAAVVATIVAIVANLTGCAQQRPQPVSARPQISTRVFDDSAFQAIGHWERVRGVHDGRSGATSTRSYHPGDILQLWVTATDLVLRGVVGPTGGLALVLLDGEPPQRIDFYARQKRAGVAVWSRRRLAPGTHLVAISVTGRHDGKSRGNYVNIDDLVATVIPR